MLKIEEKFTKIAKSVKKVANITKYLLFCVSAMIKIGRKLTEKTQK